MRKISYFTLILMLSAMAIYLCSCASSGGGVDIKNDPIKPSPELKEGTVDPATNAITITKEGITVTVEHWSRARLDRKFTTASQRSPFFYLETWSQSMQSEVFHVRIKNDTPRGVLVNFKETKFYDERKYEYFVVGLDELQYKFVSRHYMDLKTKNGLELAKQILLTEILGPSRLIPAGQSVEGFVPFYTPSSQAEKVWLILVLEKEPEVATAAYQRVDFRFDFKQDLTLRKTQPPTKR
ncbi:MAG: hypothetical protein ACPL7B_07205 [Candidatus Poribacteria bacterium]